MNVQKPIVPLEALPYTLSMVATITSQHGIERVQSNCSLSPIQYLTDDKTSAQVKRIPLSVSTSFLVELVPAQPSHTLLVFLAMLGEANNLTSLFCVTHSLFLIIFPLLLIVLLMEETCNPKSDCNSGSNQWEF